MGGEGVAEDRGGVGDNGGRLEQENEGDEEELGVGGRVHRGGGGGL